MGAKAAHAAQVHRRARRAPFKLRAVIGLSAFCLAGRSAILAQTQAALPASPRFDVTSIKPSDPRVPLPGRVAQVSAAPGSAIVTTPGLLRTRNASLKDLIKGAWGLEDHQVAGGPEWISSVRFDIEAKAASPADRALLMTMLRALLADRFKLGFHHETKTLAVYALTVAKGGPKFHPLTAGTDDSAIRKTDHMAVRDMASLARYLNFGADRPVIDQTGLTGSFDADLDISKIGVAARGIAGEAMVSPANMFEATANALPGQLGLKMAPTKAPVEIFVVDHAEKPGAN